MKRDASINDINVRQDESLFVRGFDEYMRERNPTYAPSFLSLFYELTEDNFVRPLERKKIVNPTTALFFNFKTIYQNERLNLDEIIEGRIEVGIFDNDIIQFSLEYPKKENNFSSREAEYKNILFIRDGNLVIHRISRIVLTNFARHHYELKVFLNLSDCIHRKLCPKNYSSNQA